MTPRFDGPLNAALDKEATQGRETIVVRGDLFSDSGYGRATRALSRLLAGCCRHLIGVSLHDHPARRTNAFPYVVISGATLISDPRLVGCCIVNVCLPNDFVAMPLAYNVGYFFWETEQYPPREFWKAKLRLMDELWAPSSWQASLLEQLTGGRKVAVVPWPQGVDTGARAPRDAIRDVKAHPPQRPEQLANYMLRISADPARAAEQALEQSEHAAGRSTRFEPEASPSLGELLDSGGDIFVAVQTDAPRKGLHLLLSAWLQFRQTPEGRDAKLVIKMSSIDVTIDMYRLHFYMSLAARRPMRRLAIADAGVYFVYDRLPDSEMRALLAMSNVFVSATMGEGFGGPLAEAFAEGIPVICPDHTSCRDILGPDYPLAVGWVAQRHKLWQNIDVYSPSSVWHVAKDESLQQAMRTFARLEQSERRAIASRAAERLERTMGASAVFETLSARLGRRHADTASFATRARVEC